MATTDTGLHTHSGQMGLSALLVPIFSLVSTLALSYGYAYLCVYSPIAGWISLAFVAFFAAGIGWTISRIGRITHCRSEGYLHLNGFVCGLVGVYVSWAVFEYALLSRFDETFTATLMDVVRTPMGVWQMAEAINADGWYEVGGWTPRGNALWAFWGIEAVVTVLCAAGLATMGYERSVFCEDCRRWTRRTEGALRYGVPASDDALVDLRPDHLQPLEALAVVPHDTSPQIRVDTWSCRDCSTSAAMQVKLVEQVPDDNGKFKTHEQDITGIWFVRAEDLETLHRPRAHVIATLASREDGDRQAVPEDVLTPAHAAGSDPAPRPGDDEPTHRQHGSGHGPAPDEGTGPPSPGDSPVSLNF